MTQTYTFDDLPEPQQRALRNVAKHPKGYVGRGRGMAAVALVEKGLLKTNRRNVFGYELTPSGNEVLRAKENSEKDESVTDKAPSEIVYAVYHAVADDGAGGFTHTDEPDKIVSWSAYVRNEPDDGGTFEVFEEVDDIETENEARAAAERLAAKYGTDIIEKN
ncbi:hypothetical protein [Erythrobacter aureus]|uniref:Uncharacterized protein n=1 Tax=Erythrobacter aureus TaxID=2182384 RepID=A0A345YIV4_9SPHN|nr:hypothetical protein [Erythrobacter aureus]AXK43856.1 hypothetical protein DVR09_15490 [Erythrobacter aureus]